MRGRRYDVSHELASPSEQRFRCFQPVKRAASSGPRRKPWESPRGGVHPLLLARDADDVLWPTA